MARGNGNGYRPSLLAVDLATVGAVSLAILLAADRLALMTATVPLLLAARFYLAARVAAR